MRSILSITINEQNGGLAGFYSCERDETAKVVTALRSLGSGHFILTTHESDKTQPSSPM
jgi:hypothetical protein